MRSHRAHCKGCALDLYAVGDQWGLNGMQDQVQNMTDKWHVYMTFDGRISMAGLSGSKCHYLAEAIKDSVSK